MKVALRLGPTFGAMGYRHNLKSAVKNGYNFKGPCRLLIKMFSANANNKIHFQLPIILSLLFSFRTLARRHLALQDVQKTSLRVANYMTLPMHTCFYNSLLHMPYIKNMLITYILLTFFINILFILNFFLCGVQSGKYVSILCHCDTFEHIALPYNSNVAKWAHRC